MSAHTSFLVDDGDLVASLGALFRDVPEALWDSGDVYSRAWDAALLDPARDILSRSGKGLRARTLERSWRLAGGSADGPPALLPVVIELLHVGSLVIDDIEDDSRFRRGRPALHREYGLPVALNTGNWMYFVALAVLARTPLPDHVRLGLYEDTSLALMKGHQGQALDLSVRVTSTRRSDVPGLVARATRLKTGSLVQLASRMGARSAGADGDAISALGAFGTEVGVALQMLDDWSGVHVEARKEKGREDIKLARPTWAWAWLSDGTDEVTYQETVRQTREISMDWDADQVLDRLNALLGTVAPANIRSQVNLALDALPSGLAETELSLVRDDLDELERAYG